MAGPVQQLCELEPDPIITYRRPSDPRRVKCKSLFNGNGKNGIAVRIDGDTVNVCEPPNMPRPMIKVAGWHGVGRVVVSDVDTIKFADGRYGLVLGVNHSKSEDVVELDDEEEEGEESDDESIDGFRTKKQARRSAKKAARRISQANEEKMNGVLLYVDTLAGYVHARTIFVRGQITCLRTLVNPADMETQGRALSERIRQWSCVMAIGCTKGQCWLSQLSNMDATDPSSSLLSALNGKEIPSMVASTNALRSHLQDRCFYYHAAFSQKPSVHDEDDVWVSALAYLPHFGAAIVGLSIGGVIVVPLDAKTTIMSFPIAVPSLVSHLVVLEPENDPRECFYIWSAHEKSEQQNRMFAICYKVEKVVTDTGKEYVPQQNVVMKFTDAYKWIGMHPVLKKRPRRDPHETSHPSLIVGLDTTQLAMNDGWERTLMFYSLVMSDGSVRGGIFDLNAHYSKRCITNVIGFDDFGQNHICSQFKMRPEHDTRLRREDIREAVCVSATRFTSPIFDRDPLFAPGALDLDIQLHGVEDVYWGTVNAFQKRVLNMLSHSLPTVVPAPDTAVQWLTVAGLILNPVRRRQEENEKSAIFAIGTVYRALVSSKFRKCLEKFIKKRSDRRQRLNLGRWMFNEMKDIVAKMDEAIAPLFASGPSDLLAQQTSRMLKYCPEFFETAERIFTGLRDRGYNEMDDTVRLRHSRALHATTAFSLRLFVECVLWFTQVLPAREPWTLALLEEIRDMVRERRQMAAAHRNTLFLDALLTRLYQKSQDDDVLWGDHTPLEWYPPSIFNLVSATKSAGPSMEDRAALILYFLMDADKVIRLNLQRPDEERRPYDVQENVSLFTSLQNSTVGRLIQYQEGLRDEWMKDCLAAERPAEDEPMAEEVTTRDPFPREGLTDEEKVEMKKLLDYPMMRLHQDDEARLKALMRKMRYWKYRWNLYLIKKMRFAEVEDLPVPQPYEHSVVAEYDKFKYWVLQRKAELPHGVRVPAADRMSGERSQAAESTVAAQQSIVSTTLFGSPQRTPRHNITVQRGKTPKRLTVLRAANMADSMLGSDRQTTSRMNASEESFARPDEVSMANGNVPPTTPALVRLRRAYTELEDVDEEQDSDLVPDELAKVREALRTPRAREASRRAVRPTMAVMTGGDTTPEGRAPPALAPTSILKSAKKDVSQSAIKNRLRFAVEFDQKTISPREGSSEMSTSMDPPQQPDFDDSFEDGEREYSKILERVHASRSSLDDSSLGTMDRVVVEEGEESGGNEEREEREEKERPMEEQEDVEAMEDEEEERRDEVIVEYESGDEQPAGDDESVEGEEPVIQEGGDELLVEEEGEEMRKDGEQSMQREERDEDRWESGDEDSQGSSVIIEDVTDERVEEGDGQHDPTVCGEEQPIVEEPTEQHVETEEEEEQGDSIVVLDLDEPVSTEEKERMDEKEEQERVEQDEGKATDEVIEAPEEEAAAGAIERKDEEEVVERSFEEGEEQPTFEEAPTGEAPEEEQFEDASEHPSEERDEPIRHDVAAAEDDVIPDDVDGEKEDGDETDEDMGPVFNETYTISKVEIRLQQRDTVEGREGEGEKEQEEENVDEMPVVEEEEEEEEDEDDYELPPADPSPTSSSAMKTPSPPRGELSTSTMERKEVKKQKREDEEKRRSEEREEERRKETEKEEQEGSQSTGLVPMNLRKPGVFYMDSDGIERSFEEGEEPTTAEEEKDDRGNESILGRVERLERRSSSRIAASRTSTPPRSPVRPASAAESRSSSSASRKRASEKVPGEPKGSPESKRRGLSALVPEDVGEGEEIEDGGTRVTTRVTTRLHEEHEVELPDGTVERDVRDTLSVIVDGNRVIDEITESRSPPVSPGRRSSSRLSRSRTESVSTKEPMVVPPIPAKRTTVPKKKEGEEKKEEEVPATPRRTRRSSTASQSTRKSKETEEEGEEPVTPRRSSRTRKTSEASHVSTTVPPPILVLEDEQPSSKKSRASTASPSRTASSRKSTRTVSSSESVAVPPRSTRASSTLPELNDPNLFGQAELRQKTKEKLAAKRAEHEEMLRKKQERKSKPAKSRKLFDAIPEEAEEAKKGATSTRKSTRGRGKEEKEDGERSEKTVSNRTRSSESSFDATAVSATPRSTRKRTASTASEIAVTATPSTAPRKRGRPRKHPEEEKSVETEEDPDEPGPSTSRGTRSAKRTGDTAAPPITPSRRTRSSQAE